MKIIIDISRILNEKAGVGRYCRNLLHHILSKDSKNEYLLVGAYLKNAVAKKKILNEFKKDNVRLKIFPLPSRIKESLWQAKLPILANVLPSADIYLALSFLDFPFWVKAPKVLIVYDLTTFRYPEHLGEKISADFNQKTKLACQAADKIIAISKATKNDLIELLKIPPGKIEVIYPGRTDFRSVSKSLPSGLKKQAFILTVGTIEPRKNLEGLFKAYALLPPNLQEKYPLAVVGAEGWQTAKIFNTFNRLNLGGKVKFLGYVSDEVLARLYREAAVFCYPSLYEGFGFPVLEALSFGTPAVISRTSSLPEVAGRGALYVDPQDPKSISGGLERLLEHKEEAEGLRKLALIEAQKFSWEKTAHETLKVFERIERK